MGSRAAQVERRHTASGPPNLGRSQPKLGRGNPEAVRIADALFTRTQQAVLGCLFGQPDKCFYASDLGRGLGVGSCAVQRVLARFQRGGLVTMKPVGNQKHYQANAASPLFPELTAIARKTGGLPPPSDS